jgi:hypothetical protein
MTAVVEHQHLELCQVVNDANPHFWDVLVDKEVPPLFSSHDSGTIEEAYLTVHQCRAAWHESEDTIPMVNLDTTQFTSVRYIELVFLVLVRSTRTCKETEH